MRRTLNVVRLQLINKSTFIWTPLIVLAGAVIVSVLIYAMIPLDGPKYGGGGQAPLWVFFAMGITAMTFTFPFSQAISIARREFFVGTMISAVLGSAFMGVLFLLGGAFEMLTDGYGVNGWVFALPWLWDAGPFAAFLAYFTLALLFFVLGFTGATIFKRWGAVVLTTSGVVIALLLAGLLFLMIRLELWEQAGAAISQLGPSGVALWGLVLTVALLGVSFLIFRRALP